MLRRRSILKALTGGLALPLVAPGPPLGAAVASPPPPPSPTGSDVGSLFPFIQSQAVRGDFPLSFLRDDFRDVAAWRRMARAKLLDLLAYSPPPCDPRAEVIERVELNDHIRERVLFNTTPDVRVPAFVLVPKGGKRPAPGIVALHDHGGF